jgi:hypothetical protein
MDTFNELVQTGYNDYIYDGNRIVERRQGKDGNDFLVLESVTGMTKKFQDDLSPEEKLQLLARQAQDPKKYLQQRLKADKARREYNAEQWKDPVPVKGSDGKTYYMVKQVDPGEMRPAVLVFDHEPGPDSEPINVEGSRRFFTEQAMELDAAEKEGRAPEIPTLTKNQAIGQLRDEFYKTGPMGAMESRMNNADAKFRVATQAFDRYMKDAEESGNPIRPLEAKIRARNHVDRIEADYFAALAEYPDEKEDIQREFKKQYGYVPDPAEPPAGNLAGAPWKASAQGGGGGRPAGPVRQRAGQGQRGMMSHVQ